MEDFYWKLYGNLVKTQWRLDRNSMATEWKFGGNSMKVRYLCDLSANLIEMVHILCIPCTFGTFGRLATQDRNIKGYRNFLLGNHF